MALPPPKHNEIGAFYLVFGLMELSAGLGYTTAAMAKARVLEVRGYEPFQEDAGSV